MDASTKSLVPFSVSVLVVAVVAAAVSVYGFGHFEKAWGRGGSFQVELWFSFAASVLAAFGSGFGFRLGGARSRRLPAISAAVSGALFLVLSLALAQALDESIRAVGLFGVGVWLVVGSFVFAFSAIKLFGRVVKNAG